MKLRRVQSGAGSRVEVEAPQGWVPAADALSASSASEREAGEDIVALLALPQETRNRFVEAASSVEPSREPGRAVLPFAPRSFRDFMLYEAHAIAAARGFVERYMPAAARLSNAYEAVTGRSFPPLRPHRLWYDQPIYYMGNHLTVGVDGNDVEAPAFSDGLDYELELGFVLAHPLRDAEPDEAERAIGGFVVLNDFTARDVQLAEMRSGFGPQKAKHFASTISAVVVSADEILSRWTSLSASVRLNGAAIADCSTAGARWSLGEVLAHASRCEQLHPGELFGTGTLPGGSGIESGQLLIAGDHIELAIEGIGVLGNRVV